MHGGLLPQRPPVSLPLPRERLQARRNRGARPRAAAARGVRSDDGARGHVAGQQGPDGSGIVPADGVIMRFAQDVWRSIVRRDPLSTAKGKSELVFLNLWLHIHPTKVRRE